MLAFEPRVAVVDDKRQEVEGIIEHYQNEGIGVKYYDAHLFHGVSKPNVHFSNLNLIFLDIHFTDTFSDYDPIHCAEWIESLIPKYSFYILVLWSKETDKKDEIIEILKEIKREPFICLGKQKTDFKTKDGWDFKKLNDSIQEELNSYAELEELANWKKSIVNSSNVIIGHLSNDSEQPKGLKRKLQKIIIGHGGTYLLGKNNELKKRKVLFDALDNILSSNSKSTRPNEDISQSNTDSLYNIPSFPKMDVDSKLNSWFHFKLIEKEKIEKGDLTPGLLSLNSHSLFKKLYSILDDPKLSSKFKMQIKSKTTAVTDIVVILSRPCDIAQNKYGKNIKLLSGIKLLQPRRFKEEDLTKKQKEKRYKYIGNLHFNNEELPDSVKVYDHLAFSEQESDVTLIFDYRYMFSVPEKTFIDKFENIKIFNKELLSEIQVEYSAYSSRLGITQII